MAAHLEEEEQVEALKRWWKANGGSIIAGIILGLAAIFGWNTWNNYQQNQAQQSSDLYTQLLDAVGKKQYDLADGIAERLTGEYGGTVYADFARLFQARVALDQGQPEEAKKSLGMLLTQSKDSDIRHIARLRQARVLLSLGNPQDGLEVLTSKEIGDPGKFAGQYEEFKGDMYVALGREDEAARAYHKAIELRRDHAILDAKLNDLGEEASDLP